MFLKKIEIFGFKSFSDKTEIIFKDGKTVIVGPNGCGKSNILDAVKWVMGEQSAKSLRGGRMEDVIFNGTRKRAPLNFCEVNLILDNTNNYLKTDLSEVSISRRLFRDGESVYMINKQPCRLKDVVNLFLDTGVGKNAYSIIEQGKIDSIINSKPIDRRTIFEEASGINKYRICRDEASRKLNETEQNLSRIKDIRDEVEKRYEIVKHQAEKSEKYFKLKNEIKDIEILLGLKEHRDLNRRINELNGQISNDKTEEDNLMADLSAFEGEKNKIKEDIVAIEGKHSSVLEKRTQIIREIEGNRTRLESISQNKEERQNRKSDLKSEIDRENNRLKELTDREENLKNELNILSENIKTTEIEWSKFREETDNHNLRLEQVNNNLKEKRIIKDEKLSAKEIINEKYIGLRENVNNILKEKSRFATELSDITLKTEEHKKRISELNNKRNSILENIETIRKNVYDEENELVSCKKELSQINIEITELDSRLAGLKAQKKVIEEYLKSAEISGEENYKLVRDNNEKYYCIAGDIIDEISDKEWGVVIDRFIPEIWKTILIKSKISDIDFNSISSLKEQLFLFYNKTISTKENLQTLDNIIKFKDNDYAPADVINNFFKRIILIEDMSQIDIALPYLDEGFSILVKEGLYIRQDGVISSGNSDREGAFSYRLRLNDIKNEIKKYQTIKDEKENLRQNLSISISNKEEKLIISKKELNESEKELNRVTAVYEGIEKELQHLLENHLKIETEYNNILDGFEKNNKEMALSKEELDVIENNINKLIEEIFSLENEEKSISEYLKEKNNKTTQLRERYLAERERQEYLKNTISDLKQIISDSKIRIEKITHELNDIDEDIENRMHKVEEETVSYLRQLENELQNVEKLSEELSQNRQLLKNRIDEIEKKYITINSRLRELQETYHNVELKIQKSMNRIETIESRIKEEFETNLSEMDYNILEAEINWAEKSRNRNIIKREINKLGAINFEAADEYKDLQERRDFLNKQISDLETACNDLIETINKIDVKSSQMFMETFQSIRNNFQIMFTKFFGGGHADLVLQDSENILESGIEIMASPPGKKPQSIVLLSGGEKALTAIALIFGIFLVKPSPFCILDEVDAPLDENNIVRFVNMVDEFSKKTQFLVISHSKRTMEVADHIYGVTQLEQGISSILSLKIEEAEAYIEEEDLEDTAATA